MCLIFVEYPTRTRLKVFGYARCVEPTQDPELITRLRSVGERTYTGQVESAMVVDLVASDTSCSKHITPRWDRDHISELTEVYRPRVDDLRAQIDQLRGQS